MCVRLGVGVACGLRKNYVHVKENDGNNNDNNKSLLLQHVRHIMNDVQGVKLFF